MNRVRLKLQIKFFIPYKTNQPLMIQRIHLYQIQIETKNNFLFRIVKVQEDNLRCNYCIIYILVHNQLRFKIIKLRHREI